MHRSDPRQVLAALEPSVAALMRELKVPGVAVAAVSGSREAVAAFGVRRAGERLPVTPETLFQAGSITKTVTATALVELVRAGRVDLDEPLIRHLPDLRLPGDATERMVTLRHLLTHTGGWEGDFFDTAPDSEDALDATVGRLAAVEARTPLGRRFSYNNAGFYIAGRLLEVLTSKSYEEAARELVLGPAGMVRSRFMPVHPTEDLAWGHVVVDSRPQPVRPWGLPRALNPVAGLVTCAADLAPYARHHLRNFPEMRRPHRPAGGVVGLGWMLSRHGTTRVASHTGTTNGHRASLTLVPRHRFAFGVLTSSDRGAELHRELTREALRAGARLVEPEPGVVQLPPSVLTRYAGTYSSALTEATVTADGEGLLLEARPRTSLTPFEPRPPLPPPVRLRFTARDRAIAVDPPFTGQPAEFVWEGGRVRWLRWGSRLLRREA